MPRTAIPVGVTGRTTAQTILAAAETAGDAANDHEFANDGQTVLIVRNAVATTRTLEVVKQTTVDGDIPAVKSYSILSAEHKILGPFPVAVYGTLCQVNVDHTDLKLQCWRIGY